MRYQGGSLNLSLDIDNQYHLKLKDLIATE